jgi:hypothetical protein
LRSFFQENAAIFLPSQKTWIKPQACIWRSKYALRHKCVLSAEYPTNFENLFRLCIGVKDAQIDDVITELQMWSIKEDEDMEYLKTLFLALHITFKTSTDLEGSNKSKEKLQVLRNVKCIPLKKMVKAVTQRQAVSFNDAACDWFVIDSCRLEDAFRGQAWLLDFSLEASQKLKPFLEVLETVFSRTRPGLTQIVEEHAEHAGLQGECPHLSQRLQTRSSYFAR